MSVVDKGIIQSPEDLIRLGIIDFNRLNGYWASKDEAVIQISQLLINHTTYTLIEDDLKLYPDRSDWSGWNHVGNHPEIGRLYWNWFHSIHSGKLVFSDEPDFWGHLESSGEINHFRGDIGKVSASTFFFAIRDLAANDLWITVLNDHIQVVLEPLFSIREARFNFYKTNLNIPKIESPEVQPISQKQIMKDLDRDFFDRMTLKGEINTEGKLVVELPPNMPSGRVVVQILQPLLDFIGSEESHRQ